MSTASVHNLITDTPEHQAFTGFVELINEKRELKLRLEDIEAQLNALEPVLLAYLGEGGYQMVRVGGYTLSPHREPWVYPAPGNNRDTVCRVLKACGLGHYVHEQYSTRALTKYVRDLEEQHQLASGEDAIDGATILPPALAKVVQIQPSYRIQALRR